MMMININLYFCFSIYLLLIKAAVGIELWSMSENILFDNIIVTDDSSVAQHWAEQTFDLKRKHLEKQAVSILFRKCSRMKNLNISISMTKT